MTLTLNGKNFIKRYLAGQVPAIGKSIAFGIGGKAEVNTDLALQFEVARADVNLTSYDFINDRLIFKATIPDQFIGTIYEVGLFSSAASALNSNFTSQTISGFDSTKEFWTDGAGNASTYTTANARVGGDWLVLSPATTATAKAVRNIALNFASNNGSDYFTLAFNVGSNVANVKLRFAVDGTNYYEYTATSPTAGYNLLQIPKNSFTATGTPNWANITAAQVSATATGSGSASVNFDGIRIDSVQNDTDYVMISRELLASPFVKEVGKAQEIEFTLNVTI